mmetsp:Transcript_3234/g.5683  ORF Transcript_3234/g.5683 Transcript_3234/m.5683 type:complete len:225 (-) Transcript_3234:818-1492(-)
MGRNGGGLRGSVRLKGLGVDVELETRNGTRVVVEPDDVPYDIRFADGTLVVILPGCFPSPNEMDRVLSAGLIAESLKSSLIVLIGTRTPSIPIAAVPSRCGNALSDVELALLTDCDSSVVHYDNIEYLARFISHLDREIGHEQSGRSTSRKLPHVSAHCSSQTGVSLLESIPGLSSKTAKIILQSHSLAELSTMSEKELQQFPGIGKESAAKIHKFLHDPFYLD